MSYAVPSPNDIIIAPASFPAASGVMVVRLSGPGALALASHLTVKALPPIRQAGLRMLIDRKGLIDKALVLCFEAPYSFTGEEIVEFQMHGSLPLVRRLLQAAFDKGARLAQPGEFSRRAFEHGRMDLSQAEGLLALIHANSESEAEAARQVLEGALGTQIKVLLETLTLARAHLEVTLDFEDHEAPVDQVTLISLLQTLQTELSKLQTQAALGEQTKHKPSVVLLGLPNAGKSSLFNRLVKEESALVSAIAGTTRDINKEWVRSARFEMMLIDTAGLGDSKDELEKAGIQRAQAQARQGKVRLWVFDAADCSLQQAKQAAKAALGEARSGKPGVASDELIYVGNKIDLLDRASSPKTSLKEGEEGFQDQAGVVWVSAAQESGIDTLEKAIEEHLSRLSPSGGLWVSARQAQTLQLCEADLQEAMDSLDQSELAAESLRILHQRLRSLLGQYDGDASAVEPLLEATFSQFCLGK